MIPEKAASDGAETAAELQGSPPAALALYCAGLEV